MKLACVLALVWIGATVPAFAEKRIIQPKEFAPGGPFNAAILVDGTLYVSGTTSATGPPDAFVVHLLAGGKAADAETWGSSSGNANGAGVGVAGDGTIRLAATAPSPTSAFLAAARQVSMARGTLTVAAGSLTDATDTISDPAQAVTTPNGTTTFGGLDNAALIRIAP